MSASMIIGVAELLHGAPMLDRPSLSRAIKGKDGTHKAAVLSLAKADGRHQSQRSRGLKCG